MFNKQPQNGNKEKNQQPVYVDLTDDLHAEWQANAMNPETRLRLYKIAANKHRKGKDPTQYVMKRLGQDKEVAPEILQRAYDEYRMTTREEMSYKAWLSKLSQIAHSK